MATEDRRIEVENGVEGFVTGKNLSQYESVLGFARRMLRGRRVLNYGCGTSDLSSELQQSRILARVVDVDLFTHGIRGRRFVRADGRYLPFVDRAFDVTFAFTATYQTPFSDKRQMYDELLRVSNIVPVHPVLPLIWLALLQQVIPPLPA